MQATRDRVGEILRHRGITLLPVGLCAAVAYHELATIGAPVAAPSAIHGAEEWLFSPVGNNSPVLIYILTAWLAARRLPRLWQSLGESSARVTGSATTCLALVLLVWAHYVTAPDLMVVSLVLLLLGTALLLAGRRGGRAMVLPAVFGVALSIPLPTVLINAIVYPLQLFTAATTATLLNGVGLTASQSGDFILRPEAIFHVIETCSGLRMVEIMMMSAVVHAEAVHRSRRRLVLLLLLSPLIGLVVNQMRVLSLVVNPVADQAPVHTVQGIAMMVVGVLLLVAADSGLQRVLPDPAVPERSSGRRKPKPTPLAPLPRARIAALCGAILLAAIPTFVVDPWTPPRPDEPSVHSIPRQLEIWVMEQPVLVVEPNYLGSVRFSQSTYRRYRVADGARVDLFVGVNDRIQRFNSVRSRKTETLEGGSHVRNRVRLGSPGLGQNAHELIVTDARGKSWLVHHAYDSVDALWLETLRSALALDRGPFRRSQRAAIVRLATPIPDTTRGVERARATLEAFGRSFDPEFDRLRIGRRQMSRDAA